MFAASLLVHRRELATELRNRDRDLSDLFAEFHERRMKAMLVQALRPHFRGYGRIIVAEEPNGDRHAWLLDGRALTPVPVPKIDLGLEHVRVGEIKVVTYGAMFSTDGPQVSTSPAVEEAAVPSPVYGMPS